MNAPRREITAEELQAVFALAQTYPDLRTVATDLTELAGLRQRVVHGEAALKGLEDSQKALRTAMGKLTSDKRWVVAK